ncbi:MAG TPA: hypothetical protein VIM04_08920, partial [Candidatus Binatia bacterium]
EYRRQCVLSVGRDLSNDVRLGNSLATAQKCQLVSGDSRLACMQGVVYALIDNTWDGRYALPFCATFTQPSDQNDCVRLSVEYLTETFAKSPAEIAGECATHLPQPAGCAELAAR